MPETADILVRLDAAIRELLELRRQVAASLPAPAANGAASVDDDLVPEHLLDIAAASSRFNRPCDTIRFWCRREGCGVKVGGRWLASVPRIQRRLNGE